EASPPAAVLGQLLPPGRFDEDPPHRFRRGGEEVPPALELLVAHQAQVRFVNQGGGLERLPRRLVSQLPGGQLAQLVVDQRQELTGGVRVALIDRGQDAGYFAHRPSLKEQSLCCPTALDSGIVDL